VRGSGWRCSAFTGPSGQHIGQGKRDNKMARGCISRSRHARLCRWRSFKRGGARLAWREDVESAPSRCSMLGRLAEHRRMRLIGNVQRQPGVLAWSGSEIGVWWRDGPL
jgi:hypothetical protein